jgi:lysophospholipase L1-like esterase
MIRKTLLIAALILGHYSCRAAEPAPYAGVVFIGDSITWRWDTNEEFPGSANEGIGGQTSQQMQARFKTDVLSKKPKVVVICAGTNDIRYQADTRMLWVDEMVEAAEADGAKVIVCILPYNTGWDVNFMTNAWGQELYNEWNAEITAGAKAYGYTLVNYRKPTQLPDGLQNKALFNADGTHPNAAGYVVLSATLRPALDEALSLDPPHHIGRK